MARERVNLNNVEASSTAMFSTLMSVVAMTFPCVIISENEAPPAVGGHRVLFRGNDLNRTLRRRSRFEFASMDSYCCAPSFGNRVLSPQGMDYSRSRALPPNYCCYRRTPVMPDKGWKNSGTFEIVVLIQERSVHRQDPSVPSRPSVLFAIVCAAATSGGRRAIRGT